VLPERPVLGLDLGGTRIRAAVILPDGRRLARVADDTGSADGPDAVVRRCIAALDAARAQAPADVAAELAGVGVSSPGPVDSRSGIVLEPPNLGPTFRDVPLGPAIEAALGLPVALDRDTVVAALGEWTFGAARGCSDFLYITVSTGIGGAVVSDGRLLRGPDGTAGELGHITTELEGPACGCGGVGHLEAIASGRALARDAALAASEGRSAFLAALPNGDDPTARDVADGEAAGDDVCVRLMARARLAFARAAVAWVDLFNPDRIVIGGSIAEHQGDRLLDPARDAIAREAFRTPARRVTLVPPDLGADVSLAGAQPLVQRAFNGSDTGSGPTALVGQAAAG
jgi:glucokinase